MYLNHFHSHHFFKVFVISNHWLHSKMKFRSKEFPHRSEILQYSGYFDSGKRPSNKILANLCKDASFVISRIMIKYYIFMFAGAQLNDAL